MVDMYIRVNSVIQSNQRHLN